MTKKLRSMVKALGPKTLKHRMMRRILFSESGPTVTEYLLLTALISMILIGVAVGWRKWVEGKMPTTDPENTPAVQLP